MVNDIKKSWAGFLAIGILILNFFPELFLKRIFANGDPIFQYYPNFTFYKSQIINHQSFLWTKSFLGGFPVYLDLSGGFFSPVNYFLFKYLPVFTAYNFALIFAFFLVLYFSYKFMRELDISRAGSLIAATVFSFGYHNMLNWGSVIPDDNAFFLLPLLALALLKIYKNQWQWLIIAGLGVGYALLTGHPEWVLMSFVGAGFYLLYLILFADNKARVSKWILISGFALSVLIGVGIASFQLIPSQHLASLGSRAAGLSYAEASAQAHHIFDWFWLIFPDFHFQYLNSQQPTIYVGVLPLIFAVLGFIFLFRRKDVRFFSFIFLFGLLTAIKFSPIFWLIHQLPVFHYFRDPTRWMYVGSFGLAALTGIGFDFINTGNIPERAWSHAAKLYKWIIGIPLALVLIGNILYWQLSEKVVRFLQAYYDKNYYALSTKLPLEHYHQAIQAKVFQFFNNINLLNAKFILAVIFLGIGYVFLIGMARKNGFLLRNLALICIVISAANLSFLSPNFHETISQSILETQPEIAHLLNSREDSSGPFRVMSVLSGSGLDQKFWTPLAGQYTPTDSIEIQRDLLSVNIGMMYGIDSIDGYNNLMSRRISRALGLLGSYRTTVGESLAYREENIDDKLSEFVSRLPLLSMLNVRYLISLYKLPPAPDLKLIDTVSSTRFKIPIYVYENSGALPRFYLAENIIRLPDKDELKNLEAITAPTADFHRQTFLECAAYCKTNSPSAKDRIHVTKYQDGLLELDASIDQGRWLVFSESNIPGWQAEIDGKPAEIYPANYLFQGIYLPAGSRTVKLEYTFGLN